MSRVPAWQHYLERMHGNIRLAEQLDMRYSDGRTAEIRRRENHNEPLAELNGALAWRTSNEASALLSEATWAHRKAQTYALAVAAELAAKQEVV